MYDDYSETEQAVPIDDRADTFRRFTDLDNECNVTQHEVNLLAERLDTLRAKRDDVWKQLLRLLDAQPAQKDVDIAAAFKRAAR